jgi:hypothetical protein
MSEIVALLFTDAVDSTLTTQRSATSAPSQLWTEHDRRARDLLRRHHGREIDRADGFLLLFDSAADARAPRARLSRRDGRARPRGARRAACRPGGAAPGVGRRRRAGREAGRSRRPREAARRPGDGHGTRRADAAHAAARQALEGAGSTRRRRSAATVTSG